MLTRIPGPVGGLEAQIWTPTGEQASWVTVCHPHPQYGGSMYNNVVDALVQAGRHAGYGVVAFNFRGVGESDGTYSGGGGEVDDLIAVSTWIGTEQRCPPSEQALAGYSFGAAVVAMALGAGLNPCCACLTAFPFKMMEMPRIASDWAGPVCVIASADDPYGDAALAASFVGESQEGRRRLTTIAGGGHFFGGFESDITSALQSFLQDAYA